MFITANWGEDRGSHGYNVATLEDSIGGDLVLAVAPAAARPRPGGGRLFIIVGVILAIAAFGAVFFISSLGGGAAIGGAHTRVVVVQKAPTPLPPVKCAGL